MRIKLEFEDGPVFSTVSHATFGTARVLLVRINGKPFTVWKTDQRSMDPWLIGNKDYQQEVDRALIAAMERLFEKIFLDACAAVPEGTELLKTEPK